MTITLTHLACGLGILAFGVLVVTTMLLDIHDKHIKEYHT